MVKAETKERNDNIPGKGRQQSCDAGKEGHDYTKQGEEAETHSH